jgi:hypothetical protein
VITIARIFIGLAVLSILAGFVRGTLAANSLSSCIASIAVSSKLTVKRGKSVSLSLSNTKIKKDNVEWQSSDTDIVMVDKNGKIWAISAGQVIIYTNTGGFRNECTVTVK